MIFILILTGITSLLAYLLQWLPSGLELPWGLDGIMIMAVGYFNAFVQIFPPLGIVVQAFLIYIGFKLGIMILKLFLGSRAPIT